MPAAPSAWGKEVHTAFHFKLFKKKKEPVRLLPLHVKPILSKLVAIPSTYSEGC